MAIRKKKYSRREDWNDNKKKIVLIQGRETGFHE